MIEELKPGYVRCPLTGSHPLRSGAAHGYCTAPHKIRFDQLLPGDQIRWLDEDYEVLTEPRHANWHLRCDVRRISTGETAGLTEMANTVVEVVHLSLRGHLSK